VCSARTIVRGELDDGRPAWIRCWRSRPWLTRPLAGVRSQQPFLPAGSGLMSLRQTQTFWLDSHRFTSAPRSDPVHGQGALEQTCQQERQGQGHHTKPFSACFTTDPLNGLIDRANPTQQAGLRASFSPVVIDPRVHLGRLGIGPAWERRHLVEGSAASKRTSHCSHVARPRPLTGEVGPRTAGQPAVEQGHRGSAGRRRSHNATFAAIAASNEGAGGLVGRPA